MSDELNYGDLIVGASAPVKRYTLPQHIDGTQLHLTAANGSPNYTPFFTGNKDEMLAEVVINNQVGIQTNSTRVLSVLNPPLLSAPTSYYIVATVRRAHLGKLFLGGNAPNGLPWPITTFYDQTSAPLNFVLANTGKAIISPKVGPTAIVTGPDIHTGTVFADTGDDVIRFDIPPTTFGPITVNLTISNTTIVPSLYSFRLGVSIAPWTLDSGTYPDTFPTHVTYNSNFPTPSGSPVNLSGFPTGAPLTRTYSALYSTVVSTSGPGSYGRGAILSSTIAITITVMHGVPPGP